MSEEQEYYEITDYREAFSLGLYNNEVFVQFPDGDFLSGKFTGLIPPGSQFVVQRGECGILKNSIFIPAPTVDILKDSHFVKWGILDQSFQLRESELNLEDAKKEFNLFIKENKPVYLWTGSSWIPLKAGKE